MSWGLTPWSYNFKSAFGNERVLRWCSSTQKPFLILPPAQFVFFVFRVDILRNVCSTVIFVIMVIMQT